MNLQNASGLYLDSQDGMISRNTRKIYRHAFTHLIRFFGEKTAVKKIDKLKAEKFRSHLVNSYRYSDSQLGYRIDGKKLAVSTVRQIMKISRILFSWLLEIGEVEINPFSKLKLPPIPDNSPETVSVPDFEKFLFEAQLGKEGRANNQIIITRDLGVLHFLHSTGCRVSGLASTQVCDLKFYEDSAETIVREKYKGGPKARPVFLNDVASLAVMLWLDVRPPTQGHDCLFVNVSGRHKGHPLSADSVRRMIYKLHSRYQKRCELNAELEPMSKKISPHRLRATAISRWLESGLSDTVVSRLAGNSELVMRKHYAHIQKKSLLEAHRESSKQGK